MSAVSVLCTRSFDARVQGDLVLALFQGLKPGESFEVWTEDGNERLVRSIGDAGMQNLKWQFLERSPRQWRMKVEKTAPSALRSHESGGCCGMCGG